MVAAPPLDSDPRIAMLETENTVLRSENEDLRRIFVHGDLVLPVYWGLTATEERIVALLLRRRRVTKEQFHVALRGDEREINIAVVESHICKARRKLRLFQIEIKSARYQGYWIEQDRRYELLAQAERMS